MFKKKVVKYGEGLPSPYKKMRTHTEILENVDESLRVYDGSRFSMIITAAERARDLKKGNLPFINTKSGPCVTALLEIAAGKVKKTYMPKSR